MPRLKVLVADDNRLKIKQIIECLTESCSISRDDIEVAYSGFDARKKLAEKKYDFFILDISLPLREENEPASTTSIEILEEIYQKDGYITPDLILGITAYSEALKEASDRFMENLCFIVEYSETSDEWEKSIITATAILRQQKKIKKTKEYDVDLCIVTALKKPELSSILSLPWGWSCEEKLDECTFIYRGEFYSNGKRFSVVAAHAPRMGMVSSAILSAKLISELRPKYIVMAGICAGVEGKVNLGDIIFADPCWDWQSGKRIENDDKSQFSIAPHQLSVSEFVKARVNLLADNRGVLNAIKSGWPISINHELNLVSGPLVSGSAVLADHNVVDEIITQHRNLVGIEMEVYGLYAAVSSAGVPKPTAFAMKSVCDFANSKKDDDYQAYASYTSAQAIRSFFEVNMDEISSMAGR